MSYRGLATQSAGSVRCWGSRGEESNQVFTPRPVVSISANSSGDFGLTWSPVGGFVKELGRWIQLKSGERRSCSFLMQRLSVAIQRGNLVAVLGTLANSSD